ncbi:unnamed protein product [Rotaria sp. Silwood1]|nr:unnamed protein product [Rotaria sp. Silwood1]CAF4821852.1 unnamed protein product [Rotaria sp. Silwood1]
MGDYTTALKTLKSAYQIQQKIFEEGNPAFASTYSWFEKVYRNQKTLPEGHPYFGITYSNIGDVHRLMGDYEKALTFHRKALNIQENIQCNPLECATTYINLGETCRQMKDYSTALLYYQKGIEIRGKKLSKSHPVLAVVYHNLAKLYLSTRQYNMTIKNVQQAIEIAHEK